MKSVSQTERVEELVKFIYDFREGVKEGVFERGVYPHLNDQEFVKDFLENAIEMSKTVLDRGDTISALAGMSEIANYLRIIYISKKTEDFPKRLHTLWREFYELMYLSSELRIDIRHWVTEAEEIRLLVKEFLNSRYVEFDSLKDSDKVSKSLRMAYKRFVNDPKFRKQIEAHSPDGRLPHIPDED